MYRIFMLSLIMTPVLASDSGWLEKLKVNGDFRGRYEVTDYDSDRKDRERFRIRLRVQAAWQVNESWQVGARLVTGNPDDAHSTHETLEGFDEIDASLDRAFIQYHKNESRFVFGKFAHPFKTYSAYGELVWDGDVQPEGMAYEMIYDYFYAMVSYYILDERAEQSDINAVAVQAGGESDGSLQTSWGLSYYLYSDLEGNLPEEMALVDAQAAISFPLGKFKATAAVQYVLNTETQFDQDTAVAGSLALKTKGRLKKAYVQYQKVEEDSVLQITAQDDFLSPSNFEGWVIGAQVGLWKKMALHGWALSTEDIIGEPETDMRYRLDLNVTF